MRRRFAVLCLLLACPAWGAELTLPPVVKGEPGAFIEVPAKTDGKEVKWVALDKGLNVFPVRLLKDSRTAVVVAKDAGPYRLLAYTSDAAGPSEPAICIVEVGVVPGPPVPPGTTPVPPGPVSGLRVVFVTESANTLTREQVAILKSTKIADYLNTKAAKTNNRPDWRRWDKDQDVTFENATMKALWAAIKPQLGKLPALVVVTDQKGEVFPLPETEAATLEFLERYGGK